MPGACAAWIDRAVRQVPAEILDWEGAAADLACAVGYDDPPVDAFQLADACELIVEPAAVRTAELDHSRRLIKLNVRMRRERQHMSVAHELGHFALVRSDLVNDCDGARYVAGALMLPRGHFDRDLSRTAWSLSELKKRHHNASATAIAVRITQLRDAVVTVLAPNGGPRPWRIASPWVSDRRLRRVSSWEHELAAEAYATRTEVRGDELCYAVPLLDGPVDEHRVVVVCELEQLSLRL